MTIETTKLHALLHQYQAFPERLAQTYPHVLAKIVDAWDSPELTEMTFADLMLADNRRKQGFPQEVMTEIFVLAKLHDRLYPKPASSALDIWSRSAEFSHDRKAAE